MEIKKEIESVLDFLKNTGFDRGAIEEELGYSENYIDQVLSKGGNNRFLNAIKKLKARVLQKAIQPSGISSIVEEPKVEYEKLLPMGDLRITLKDYFNLLEEKAKKAEEREKEYLEIIKKSLNRLEANSKELSDNIEALTTEIQAEHGAMMDSIDVAAKQPIGTTAAAAGTFEITSEQEHLNKGKKTGTGRKVGAGKQG